MSENCEHYWIPSKIDVDGNAVFRMHRQMSAVPLTHAKCKLCNARTWFTEAQWLAIPVEPEPTVSEMHMIHAATISV